MNALESQLFDWKECAHECMVYYGDHECMIYYNVVLKVPIGKHPVGSKFDTAVILFEKSILQLSNSGPMVNGFAETILCGEYKLNLSVGEEINNG